MIFSLFFQGINKRREYIFLFYCSSESVDKIVSATVHNQCQLEYNFIKVFLNLHNFQCHYMYNLS